jgi:hypothetical protein
MVNYNNGKIYKIEAINGDDGDIYIGSTTKQYLSQRMENHRAKYKQWKNHGKTNKLSCFDMFDKYGIENCYITLLEAINANSKDELHARESYYIKNNLCINKQYPRRSRKEYYSDNKEDILNKKKDYRIKNTEKIKEYQNQYHQNNIEKLKEYNKKHYELNKEKRKEYSKKYYNEHKNI